MQTTETRQRMALVWCVLPFVWPFNKSAHSPVTSSSPAFLFQPNKAADKLIMTRFGSALNFPPSSVSLLSPFPFHCCYLQQAQENEFTVELFSECLHSRSRRVLIWDVFAVSLGRNYIWFIILGRDLLQRVAANRRQLRINTRLHGYELRGVMMSACFTALIITSENLGR